MVDFIRLPASGGYILPPYHKMEVHQYLESPNKRFKLYLQDDSNLALYDGPNAIWAANADTPYSHDSYRKVWSYAPVASVEMQYNVHVVDPLRSRIWNTINSTPVDRDGAAAANRAYLQVQDDGNLVVIDAVVMWAANTTIPVAVHLEGTIIQPGTIMRPGDIVRSGQTQLVLQHDGNMVVYGPNSSPIWNTETQNGAFAVMQTDGNFVLYDANSNPVWSSNTSQYHGAYLRLQANGNLAVVYDKIVWARFGYIPEIVARRVYYPDHTDPIENSTNPFPTFGHIGYEF